MGPQRDIPFEIFGDHVNGVDSPRRTSVGAGAAGSISEFFRGRSVLVTGASGFMGKVLVEKLLRTCPGLDRIYLVLRPKRGQKSAARMSAILDSPVFDALRAESPHVLAKVVSMEGDLLTPGMGISPADRAQLSETVSVVFHVAASVRFNEPLRQAFDVNIRGTRAVLELCRTMKKLVSLVHVSTAYCNCTRDFVEEKVYPAPTTAAELQEQLAKRNERQIEKDTPSLMGKYPNSYTFTKAVAENVVVDEGSGLPVAIVRPSIVSPAWSEPFPGWVDSLNGPVGPWVAIGKGTLSCVYGDAAMRADLVPVDVCINLMIAAAWDVAVSSPGPECPGVRVYNCVSGASNPVTWGHVNDLWLQSARGHPYETLYWFPSAWFTRSRPLHVLCTVVGKSLPAYAVDLVARILGQGNPRLAGLIAKQTRMMRALDFFTTNQWSFSDANVRSLWAKLSVADRTSFPFDVSSVDWQELIEKALAGTKKFILKERQGPSKAGRRLIRLFYLLRLVATISIAYSFVWFLARPSFYLGYWSSKSVSRKI